ncbi:hypothetical protein ABG067_001896 [Albugo candida]
MRISLAFTNFFAILHLEGVSATTAGYYLKYWRSIPKDNSRELTTGPKYTEGSAHIAPFSPLVHEKTPPHVQITTMGCATFASCFKLPAKVKRQAIQRSQPMKIKRRTDRDDYIPDSKVMTSGEFFERAPYTHQIRAEADVTDDDLSKSTANSDDGTIKSEVTQQEDKEAAKKKTGYLKSIKKNLKKVLKHMLTP